MGCRTPAAGLMAALSLWEHPHMSFAVLFVCTGNICRSPAAERLFRARSTAEVLLEVTSAGTSGLAGYPIDGPTTRALQELGIDPDGHRARRMDGEMLRASDLILTAAVEHRSEVLHTEPSLLAKTFTLREFARLAWEAPEARPVGVPTDEGLRARVAAVARQRAWTRRARPGEYDIADPYGKSLKVARATVAQISQRVDIAVTELGLSQ
jgi:protein-tyrosine phosphatase